MPPNPLPDFHHVLLLSHGDLTAADLSECHGVLCGMICGDNGRTANDFLAHLDSLELEVVSGTAFHDVMVEAFESTTAQLADDELRFNLWLPDDEESLDERTDSLAHWCTGFLAGLGLGGPMQPLSKEAAEAMEDLQQISRAGFSVDVSDTEEGQQEEENEQAFFEIVEYVRVVTLVLREEMRGPKADDPIH
jgi:yecA family protein